NANTKKDSLSRGRVFISLPTDYRDKLEYLTQFFITGGMVKRLTFNTTVRKKQFSEFRVAKPAAGGIGINLTRHRKHPGVV
ncbi:hypothetical protein, partial [Pseudomonas aeruginosa]|uniref:hypothetical protein n=1 Tax=Pseudomonas aeruginosa TaxID=287 RepID=UPI003969291F